MILISEKLTGKIELNRGEGMKSKSKLKNKPKLRREK